MKKTLYISIVSLFLLMMVACGGDETPTAVPTAELPTAEAQLGNVVTEVSINDIANIVWQWEQFQDTADVNNITVSDPSQYTLTLRQDGTAQIQADCNQVQWSYVAEGSSLRFNTLGPSTLAACGDDSLDQEYLNKLGTTATFVMSNGKLVLNLVADAGNMIFANGGAAPESGGGTDSLLPPNGEGFCEIVHPTWFSLNTVGLNYSWHANCVAATPYDQSQPPGPMGMPEHIEINFGVENPLDKQPGDPVIYIIPANAYKAQWEAAGNDSVTQIMDSQQTMLAGKPIPFANTGVLPAEEAVGALDISVQQEYLSFSDWEGFRFVGRFAQDANPVTNQGLRYIFQGYAGENDEIFVAMFWPVATSQLPVEAGAVAQEEWDQLNSDLNAYLAERTAFLNSLSAFDWEPPLTVLDTMLNSIEYSAPDTPGPEPTAVIPTPEPQLPYGRVIAPSGVHVRTGPGTAYPIIATASFGTEGAIIGRSADGQWWVTPIQGAPNNQAWVSAAYVQAFNVENVPVIQPPPPPVPTATPTPLPTPVPSINFWADRTTINAGECTTLRWDVDNIQAVWVYPQGADYAQYPTTGQGSQQVCPTQTTTYEMRVQNRDGSVEFRQVTITVNQNNPLLNTSWVVSSMLVNQVPVPGTTMSIFFGTSNLATGNGSCNSFNGPYSVGGNNIRIGPLSSGKASCGAEIDAQEQQYFTLLPQAHSYSVQGNQLIIFNNTGEEIIRFNRSG